MDLTTTGGTCKERYTSQNLGQNQQDDDIISALLHRNVSRRDVSELKDRKRPVSQLRDCRISGEFALSYLCFWGGFCCFPGHFRRCKSQFLPIPHESPKIRLNMQQQLKPSPDIQDQSTRPGKHTKNDGKSPFYSWVNQLFRLGHFQ